MKCVNTSELLTVLCVDIMRYCDVFGVTVCLYCVDTMRHSDVFGGYCLFVLC